MPFFYPMVLVTFLSSLRLFFLSVNPRMGAMGLDRLYHLLKPEFGCSRKRVPTDR